MTSSSVGVTLRFDLEWTDATPRGTAAEATRGRLLVHLGDSILWGRSVDGATPGVDWTWIDLLEHLSESWIRLAFEEGDPIGLGVALKFLRLEAEKRWEGLPSDRRDREEERLCAFEEAHDLAHALQGAWVPSLWIVRAGRQCVIASEHHEARLPIETTLQALTEAGDSIASRLTGLNDDRSRLARESWRERERIEPEPFTVLMTGLDAGRLVELAGSRRLVDTFELSPTLGDNELLAAARMTSGALEIRDLQRVLQRVRDVPRSSAAALDRWTERLPRPPSFSHPHEVGYWAAMQVRTWLGAGPTDRIHPDEILREGGVRLLDLDLQGDAIDAVACWGPKHGPAVLVNRSGRHSRHASGRRFTLAHELCHLLLDRDGALPFAEALGGRSPQDVEQRASAFAAELLLPRASAAAAFASDAEVDDVVDHLRRSFAVSSEVVAWQARNSEPGLSPSVLHRLRRFVSQPGRF